MQLAKPVHPSRHEHPSMLSQLDSAEVVLQLQALPEQRLVELDHEHPSCP